MHPLTPMQCAHMSQRIKEILAVHSIPHSKQQEETFETLLMFVQPLAYCLPVSKLLGFLWAVSKSDSILPCSHMATLQLSAPVKPIAVWERSALSWTHIHMHLPTHTLLHLADSLCWSPQTPDRMIYLSQRIAPFRLLQNHSSSSSTPVYKRLFFALRD